MDLVTVHQLLLNALAREVGGEGKQGRVGKIFTRCVKNLLLAYVECSLRNPPATSDHNLLSLSTRIAFQLTVRTMV